MSTMVPMYGFGGGGGTGAALTVTAPAGCTVTVSKDGKTKTKVAGTDGVVVFKGLATGQWTVTITDGVQTAQKTVTVTADYSTAITFFAATIHVTYPAGSTCTATDGVTTMTAPDTSGTWDCVVPNAGMWTVTVVDKGWSDTVQIDNDGYYTSVYLDKFYIYRDGKLKFDIIKNGSAGGWTNSDGKLVGHVNSGLGNALILGFDQSLSGFSTIKIKAKVPSHGAGAYYYGYVSRYNTWPTCLDNRLATVSMTSPSETVYNLDVSSLGGDYYLWFAWQAYGSNADVEIIGIGCV